MSYLLDTCLLSETVRPKPEPRVLDWIGSVPETSLFLSVLTLGEVEKGAAKLADPDRCERIRRWLQQDLVLRFTGRILPVTPEVARRWGRLMGEAERSGLPLPVIDAMLAATALVFDLTVVTRNTADLKRTGARVLCPWP